MPVSASLVQLKVKTQQNCLKIRNTKKHIVSFLPAYDISRSLRGGESLTVYTYNLNVMFKVESYTTALAKVRLTAVASSP